MARVGRLLLVLVVMFAVVYTAGVLEQRETPVEVHDVEWAGLPSPSSLDLALLATLADLNRDAAAQVALIGLVPVEQRMDTARAVAMWLGRQSGTLPDVDGYTARQRAVLDDWQRALTDYAAGRASSLARIQAISQANADLYAAMMTVILSSTETGEEVNTSIPDTQKHAMTQR